MDRRDRGWLDVGDGNRVFWEARGNPHGRAVLIVRGGPGAGLSRTAHRSFDSDVFRIVSFDQRGCGNSTLSAADPSTDMAVNTTAHLIDDMERLREHLAIDRWLLFGGSWASTLIVAYAERHPDRVSGTILIGATMTRQSEIDWLYRDVRILLPQEWERFRTGIPESRRGENLVEQYRQLINDPDRAVRDAAAHEWCAWEDAVISHEKHGSPGQYSAKPEPAKTAFVRICTHYFANSAWLRNEQLLREAHRLDGISGIVIHGRLDLSAPLRTAWELTQAWRDAELVIVDDSGHTGSPGMKNALTSAIRRFTDGDLSQH